MFTYVHLKDSRRCSGFPYQVEDIGVLSHYRTAPESYCYLKLEVCLRFSGEDDFAEDIIDGKICRTPYPHVIFKMPGMRHEFHASDHREALFFIYPAGAVKELAGMELLPQEPVVPISITGELEDLIRRLRTLLTLSEEYFSADRIDLACFAILEELCFQRNTDRSSVENRIRKIASFLQMSGEPHPDFRRIADEHGFSERSFYRHWNRFFSVTPARYITEQRMKRAAWLLKHTFSRINEISEMLHYPDDNSFSTAFRQFYGVSPRQYRQNPERHS